MKKFIVMLVFSVGLFGCGNGGPNVGGESHWLSSCAEGSTCGDDGVCVCGVCTRVCDTDQGCSGVGQLNSCTHDANAAMDALCTAETKPVSGGFCLPECTMDEQCMTFGTNFSCVDGHCVGAVCVGTEFLCLPGTIEVCETAPSGCETCECKPETDFQYYETCGDPVCGGHRASEVPSCTTETAGQGCSAAGVRCDPVNDCNSYLICADSDPKMEPGGCPISRREYKEDLAYLTSAELQSAKDELLSIPLATYRYRDAENPRRQLGFVLEDVEPSLAVQSERGQVDLYGYLSMAVATLKLQEQRIEALEARLAQSEPQIAPMCVDSLDF